MSQPSSFLLTLVRHGQTPANKARIIQGQSDVPLSDHGRLQAQCLRKHLEALDVTFDLVYTSDLCRAQETCEIIVGKDRCIRNDDRLRERAFGVIEGQTLDVFRAEAAKAGYTLRNYSSFTPSGAETLDEVNKRVRSFCQHLAKLIKPNHHVLIVTHGGVIREFARYIRDNLRCNLKEMEPMKCTPNTGVNVFKISCSQDKLLFAECLKMHEISHLEELEDDDTHIQPIPDPIEQRIAESRPDFVPLEAL
ncbi:Fructose-2,6-bisphosphatase TIGAR [Halotydeus destructor]|nr:Fructose-2,6-bisphosphatase TIGAR [Halotydeus destructor]